MSAAEPLTPKQCRELVRTKLATPCPHCRGLLALRCRLDTWRDTATCDPTVLTAENGPDGYGQDCPLCGKRTDACAACRLLPAEDAEEELRGEMQGEEALDQEASLEALGDGETLH